MDMPESDGRRAGPNVLLGVGVAIVFVGYLAAFS